jgi:hypothetical protein
MSEEQVSDFYAIFDADRLGLTASQYAELMDILVMSYQNHMDELRYNCIKLCISISATHVRFKKTVCGSAGCRGLRVALQKAVERYTVTAKLLESILKALEKKLRDDCGTQRSRIDNKAIIQRLRSDLTSIFAIIAQ